MKPSEKLMLILLDEAARDGDLPLYEAVVRRLLLLDVRGATVHAGLMGFGRHHRLHKRHLLGISDDRPITILIAEQEAKLRVVLSEIRPMIPHAVVLLLDAEVL